MSRRRTIHRTPRPMALAAGLLVAAAPLAVAGTAGAQGPNVKIGPHQVFGGEINGSDGITSTPTIQMACFGPITPGETGHPLPNQTIGVFQPEAILAQWGFTGANAHQIQVFFGAPPPTPVPPTPRAIVFTHYSTKTLPTSLVLPCAGSEDVFFVPLPMSPPTSRAFTLQVNFAGQP